MSAIEPTIGRNIYYRPGPNDHESGMQIFGDRPLDAHIVYVWPDSEVNLVVFDHNGGMHRRTRVPINCGDHIFPRAEWMPYQTQVAKGQIPPTLHAVPKESS
jgi:hypothetical protein